MMQSRYYPVSWLRLLQFNDDFDWLEKKHKQQSLERNGMNNVPLVSRKLVQIETFFFLIYKHSYKSRASSNYKSIDCFNFFFNSIIEVFIILSSWEKLYFQYNLIDWNSCYFNLTYVTCFNKVLLGLLKCQYGWSNILWLTLQTPSAQAVIKLVPSNEKLMSLNHVLLPVKVCTNVSLEISNSYGK